MNCPKCDAVMEDVVVNAVTVERCTNCKGLWFSGADHKELKRMDGSDSIDIGSAKVGAKFDDLEDVPCPVCGEIMQRIADKFQPHIHYETCPASHGVFFDAGEFKDFSHETLGDFFKSLSWLFSKKT